MTHRNTRRSFLAIAGTGTLLAACHKEAEEEDVGAVEDLMREHGVIRRILVVYRVAAQRLRSKLQAVPLDGLQRAATLMHDFAEEYHEKQLEEAHLFPMLRKSGGPAVAELDTLLAQHQRGREITAYVSAAAAKGSASSAELLAQSLDAFALMYEEHAAREDTIVFPAWKKSLSAKQLAELGELFEDIEHKTFGKDGFDDAVTKIAAIEQVFGIQPAALTAPAPPVP
jgi:hemerythrin-like domain-containing protein